MGASLATLHGKLLFLDQYPAYGVNRKRKSWCPSSGDFVSSPLMFVVLQMKKDKEDSILKAFKMVAGLAGKVDLLISKLSELDKPGQFGSRIFKSSLIMKEYGFLFIFLPFLSLTAKSGNSEHTNRTVVMTIILHLECSLNACVVYVVNR